MTNIKLEKISDIDKYLLKKDGDEGFLTLPKDMLTQITNMIITMIITLKNHQHLYHTLT